MNTGLGDVPCCRNEGEWDLGQVAWATYGSPWHEDPLLPSLHCLLLSLHQMLSLVAESQNDSSTLSFLQWKATAYGSQTPRREDSIQCRSHGLQGANWTLPVSSIVHAYFGEGVGSTYTISAINISFGGEDGKVYQEKHYLRW